MKGKALIVIAVVGGLVLAGSVAYAAIPDGGGVIHGCYLKAVGTLRVIDSPGQHCLNGLETPLNWSQTGAEGPSGPTGPAGISGYEEKVASDFITLAPGDSQGIDVTCPSGKNALGGGGLAAGAHLTLMGTGPSGVNHDRWFAVFANTTGGVAGATVEVYAICANVS